MRDILRGIYTHLSIFYSILLNLYFINMYIYIKLENIKTLHIKYMK